MSRPPSTPPLAESGPATESSSRKKHAFVTVGSTRFDALVRAMQTDAVLAALRTRGISSLTVQGGEAVKEFSPEQLQAITAGGTKYEIDVEVWAYKPSLQEDYERADLVISHAGSGTILDVLRLKKPLIVVPNPSLLDNHQQELADALADLGHLKTCTTDNLAQTIESLDEVSLVPFPQFDGSRFREMLDEEMGFPPDKSPS
ncbi:glycosyltransferase family 1 protein [Daedalea quercina L-15889]|uniref:UDP-N-acetylglucosamine transferase subunit ALG13 n=1 Tax=Daedalea quercina L-15889 TaxID=1314783 RepID=A0A165P516_9APHY|nr:glycosyltransferase family 1 protein [Daedalea quercina L-15889]